jgi:hypothetical protein
MTATTAGDMLARASGAARCSSHGDQSPERIMTVPSRARPWPCDGGIAQTAAPDNGPTFASNRRLR